MFYDAAVFNPAIDYCLAAVLSVVPATLSLAVCWDSSLPVRFRRRGEDISPHCGLLSSLQTTLSTTGESNANTRTSLPLAARMGDV